MIIPPKLHYGDEIRIIAPSSNLKWLSGEIIELAKNNIEQQNFKVTFSKNCNATDIFDSSSVQERIDDIHEAFEDKNVRAIFTVIGGFHSNQLLKYLDYDLIQNNPKILCGYSDISALQNAIYAKTGLVTYSGLHFSTWGMKKQFEYNLEYFNKCLVNNHSFEISPSSHWSDDTWYLDQENRESIKNKGFVILNKGAGKGHILGGNLCTFNLLQGTEFMPDISGSILFFEDDAITGSSTGSEFDRNLQSIIHQPNFEKVKGLVIGRFQKKSDITPDVLKHIVRTKDELSNIPIIANVDFGHTNPLITFPIGGVAELTVSDTVKLEVISH